MSTASKMQQQGNKNGSGRGNAKAIIRKATAPTKIRKSIIEAIDRRDYEVPDPEQMSRPHRIANFLDWAAEHYPKQWVPWPYILKAVNNYPRTPREDSQEVVSARHTFSSVREILYRLYDRAVDAQRGLGVRALTESTDVLLVAAPKFSSRLRSAKNSFLRVASLIDPAEVPSTPELRPHKEWFQNAIRDVTRTLMAPGFDAKLLPPRPVNAPEKKQK